jgi:uncharacterized repeat protein (TIGR01451 family)
VVPATPAPAVADLSITKTDGVTTVSPGGSITYTIVVSNAGPSAVTGATVSDVFPASLTGETFTASGTGGASGFSSGSGDINQTVNLPVGATITYTVTGTVSPTASGAISNTATVSAPAGVSDSNAANNSSTDTNVIVTGVPTTDVSVTKTGDQDPVAAGDLLTYTIVVSNNGPSAAANVTLSDAIPADTTFVSFTAPAGWTTTTPAPGGTGVVTATTPTLAAGASATFTLVVEVDSGASGTTISNSATVTTTTGDTVAANNVDTTLTDVDGDGGGPLVCIVETFNLPGAAGSVELVDDADNPGFGAIIITGTSRSEAIVVIPINGNRLRVLINGRNRGTFDRDEVQHIVVFAGSGNDTVVINATLTQDATLFGENGNDHLFGARGEDGLDGGNGNDFLYGGSGDDILCGGFGRDFAFGQGGNDIVGGDDGNDHLFGEGGNDVILGGNGNDFLYGGVGNDELFGQAGNDFLFGGPGNDILSGGDGNDRLFGSTGNDLLIGGNGSDQLFGESGDDILIGGSTAFDENQFALEGILDELNAGGSFSTRVNNLRLGTGISGIALDEFSVFDDGASDQLWGGSGTDWFITGPGDRIRDRRNGEPVN